MVRKLLVSFFGLLFLVISLQAQDVIITGVTTTDVSCGGSSDGTIRVTITGGIGNYTYLLVRQGVPVESSGPILPQTYTFTGHDKYINYIIIVSDQSSATADGFTFATIGGPEPISISSYEATDITCDGFNDGTVSVSATGETGNYLFDLSGPVNQGNGTGLFTGLPEGDYTVTVTDADGCPSSDVTPVLTVNNPTIISIDIDNVSDVECFGDNTGSISITPSGGHPSGPGSGYTYEWSGPGGFTSTSEDIANLESGDYFVTVYDGNMCSANTGPITIDQSPEITAILNSTTDVTCNGGNDGTAAITANGGAGGYSYSWDGQLNGLVSGDEDPVNLLGDVYDLTIFDALGCERTFTSFATIDEPAPLNIVVNSGTDVSCPGGSDGSADITVSGGTAPYDLQWTGATSGYTSGDEDPDGMPADDYSVLVTDDRGCSVTFPDVLTIAEPASITVIVTGTSEVSCFGGNDGSAGITVSGGTGPYLFQWTGNVTGYTSGSEDPINLVADTYDLTVTDNHGCIEFFDDLVIIDQPDDLVVTVDLVTPVECHGEATGAVEITPSGGTPPYSFSWSGPGGFSSSAEDISGLESGTYSLTFTDSRGCMKEFLNLATVLESGPITAFFTVTGVSCSGGTDGAIDVAVSGGTPDYDYDWNGPFPFTSTLEDISNLVAGFYILRVTDAAGCMQVFPAQTVNQPPVITATATSIDVDCYGAENGSVDLAPAGGIPPYSFDWTGPGGFTAGTEDISGLEPGSYSVRVTDANLCEMLFSDIASITEPDELLVNSSKTDITCSGMTDGSIDITVTGGTLPYIFAWTGPGGFNSATGDISGLEAGIYNLVLTDGNGCVLNMPAIEIIEPAPIIVTYDSHEDVSCNGQSDGSIQVEVAGGTPPLVFDWTNASGTTVSTAEDPAGLPAAVYSLAVTDAGGCRADYPGLVNISEPEPLDMILSRTDITCYGEADGSITIHASGGTAPFEYSRMGNLDPAYQPGSSFNGLAQGLYTIWTRDANLCVTSDTISINEPDEIQVLGETKSGQNLCYGDSSAQISIDAVTGGVQPYEYSINGGADFFPDPVFTGLPAGNYQTVVRDATGCTASGNLNVITQPARIKIVSFIKVDITTCNDAGEGRIIISGSGGKGVLTYILDGTINQSSGDFQNLPGGPHQVSIRDENGCTRDTSVVIQAPPAIIADQIMITDVTGCSDDSNGMIQVTGSGGTGSITYSLDGGPFQATGDFAGLLQGDYTITLRDDNDCTMDTLVSVGGPAPIVILSEMVTDITCSGAGDGIIEVIASGGTMPLEYTLDPGAAVSPVGEFTGLGPGIYTVSINDAQGCGPVISSPFNLPDPPLLVVDSVRISEISCHDAGDGEIRVYATGGVEPYQFSADNQGSWQEDSIFSGLGPDTYEVYIRDANNCIQYAGSFPLAEPPEIILAVAVTDVSTCAGDTTGVIEGTASGGTGQIVYSLDGLNYSPSGTFINLAGGPYTIYARDERGCSVSEPVSVNEPAPVTAVVTKTDATFGNLGSISISGSSGGTSPYTYSIQGPTGEFSADTAYTMLMAGDYHVVVLDQNGCTYEELVAILDVLPLNVTVNLTPVSCYGASDGVVQFVPLDAEGSVEYSIDSGLTFVPGSLFENLPGNMTYYLVARDGAGKIFTDSAMILEPEEISLLRIINPTECNAFSPTGSIDVTVTGGTPGYTYLWSDGSSEEDRAGIQSGNYILVTTDNNGCTVTDTIQVFSLVTVQAEAGPDTTVCPGISFRLEGRGGTIPSWSPAGFLDDPGSFTPLVTGITESTTFMLIVTEESSPYGCYNIDSVTISIYPPTGITATEDTFIISGSSVQLEASGGLFLSYRWEPSTWLDNPDIANPVATPLESTRYTVYAMNEYQCEESDSVFIEVIENIQVYNVFSPNGDGVNDYFEIESGDRFPDMVVEVYSRWGDLLFSTVGYDDASRWDGTARGKEAPVGTYYYVVIPSSGAKPITGNVTIIR